MKILIIGQGRFSDMYGGGQIYVKNLVAELVARNHELYYISFMPHHNNETERLWFQHLGFKECQMILPNALFASVLLSGNTFCRNDVDSILYDILPDIIHAHAWKRIASVAANKVGIPCVVTAHHGGIVCPAGTLLNYRNEICTVSAGQNTCLPCCVQSIPGWKLWLLLLRFIPLDLQLFFGRLLRECPFLFLITPLGSVGLSIREKLNAIEHFSKGATKLIAPSHAICDALVRNGIPENKIHILAHGIPLPPRQPLRPGIGIIPLRFIFVGRINHVKGVHIMLDAFRSISPEKYELHIVGGAVTKREQRYLAELKRRYSSINAIWHGSRPHDEITQHIAHCDVMIHPAIFLEVFGLTITEALAVGRPVIASRCGGAESQIRDGENGLLVPPNDVLALRQAIHSFLDNQTLLRMLSANTGEVISICHHVNGLEKIYEHTVGN